jgi:hypothetical protein
MLWDSYPEPFWVLIVLLLIVIVIGRGIKKLRRG